MTIVANTAEHIETQTMIIAKQFLTFNVEERTYGIELNSIREIRGWTPTTELPNAPPFMKGVIDIRGVIIPIFDLRNRFDMGETQPDEKNVVIIVSIQEKLIGILVDAVSDILNANTDQIKKAPHVESSVENVFVEGLISIEDKMVVILDVVSLFAEESLSKASQAIDRESVKSENTSEATIAQNEEINSKG